MRMTLPDLPLAHVLPFIQHETPMIIMDVETNEVIFSAGDLTGDEPILNFRIEGITLFKGSLMFLVKEYK